MFAMANLTRNADAVRKILDVEEDGSVYCKKPISYFLPKRLLGTPLLRPDADPIKVGFFGMLLVGSDYMVCNACGIITLGPTEVNTVLVDGEECYMFSWAAGELVFTNLTVPVINALGYDVTLALIKKAIVGPWFDADDLVKVLLTLEEFTGVRMVSHAYMDIYSSYLHRDKLDNYLPFRLVPKRDPTRLVSIPINTPGAVVQNTTSTFGGANLDDEMQAKLVHQAEKTTPIEEVLTS